VIGLDRHVERLLHSCRIVQLPLKWSAAEIREAILETVRRSGYSSCYIRPVVFRGYGQLGVDPSQCPVSAAIIVIEHGAHFGADALEKGVDIGVSSWRRLAPDTLPAMAKSAANYVNSQLVLLEARANGFADGLALDSEGFVSEGSGANVFAVHDGVVRTPPFASAILGGITRANVMTLAREMKLDVREERLPREMLYTADELFFTGTAAEVTPIRSIDRRQVGTGGRGPITARLQKEYLAIARGEAADRHGWLTHVR
jgi:branched-chain amino acid aminotransferase